jgi:lysophospholipase L1-like esterase
MPDIVHTGQEANDGTGDPLRAAFQQINQNFVQQWSDMAAEFADQDAQIASGLVAQDAEIERQFNEAGMLLVRRGEWAPGEAYEATPKREWVTSGGQAYVAATNHISGLSFPDDLLAGRWMAVDVVQLISSLAGSGGSALVGYTPAGAGAVVTDVQSKLRELAVSVKDYGGTFDGDIIARMVAGEAVVISCVGDSITWGSNGDNPGVQVASPYPVLLQALLREYYENTNITVVNRGVSGNDTTDVIARLASIKADNPDVVLLMIGTNDARTDRGISVTQYRENLRNIVRGLMPARVMMLSLPAEAGLGGVPNPRAVDSYRKTMQQVAREDALPFVDFYALFKSVLKSGAYARGDIQRDRLHFDQFGYQLMAECVFAAGLCNDSLHVAGGQFVDNVAPSIIYNNETIVTSATIHQANIRIGNNGSGIWYAFCTESDLAAVVFSRSTINASVADEMATVENLSITGSQRPLVVEQITANSSFAANVPYSVARLRVGLNRVRVSCSAAQTLDVFGFSAVALQYSQRPMASLVDGATAADPFGSSFTQFRSTGFQPIALKGQSVKLGGEVTPLAYFVPTPDATTVMRLRAFVRNGTRIGFGQQSLTGSNYYWTHSLSFNNVATFVHQYNINKVQTALGSNAAVQVADSLDAVIDVVCEFSQTLWYVNGVLIYTMPATLPAGWVMLWNFSGSELPAVVESAAIIPTGVTPGTAIPGEAWTEHVASVRRFVMHDGSVRSASLT